MAHDPLAVTTMNACSGNVRLGLYGLVAVFVLGPLAVLLYVAFASDSDPLDRGSDPTWARSPVSSRSPGATGEGTVGEVQGSEFGGAAGPSVPRPAPRPASSPEGKVAPEWPVVAVSGRVLVRGTGNPVAGARVDLVRPDRVAGSAVPVCPVVTDEEGRFRFERVPAAGPFRLEASAAGFSAVRTALFRLSPGMRLLDNVVIHVEQGGVLEGRVVRVSDGVGLEGARVVALGSATSQTGFPAGASLPGETGQEPCATTDPEGTFRLEGVAPGRVDIEVRRSGFARGRLDGIAVVSGQTRSDLVIALGTGGTFRGAVRFLDGEPASGVRVLAVDAANRRYCVSTASTVGSCVPG